MTSAAEAYEFRVESGHDSEGHLNCMRYTVTGGIPSEWIQSAYGAFRITVKDVFQKRIDVDTASEIVFSFTRELVEHSFSDQIRRVLSNAACDISDASPQHSDLIRKIWEGVKNLCQTAEEEEWQELNRPSAAA